MDRITTDPNICGGRPVIAGTRINVSVILRRLGDGATTDDVLADYPELTTDDVRAAIRYAAWLASERTIATGT